jgi:hypothetical protein
VKLAKPVVHILAIFCIATYLQIQICVKLSELGSMGLHKICLVMFGFFTKQFVFLYQPSVAVSYFILFMF